jgi:hypothetical protein
MRFGNLLFDPLMWSGSIEVLDIGVEDTVELLLMQDEQMIEAFTSYTPQEAFTDGIGSRGVIGNICEDILKGPIWRTDSASSQHRARFEKFLLFTHAMLREQRSPVDACLLLVWRAARFR